MGTAKKHKYKGQYFTIQELSELYGINKNTFYVYLSRGMCIKDILIGCKRKINDEYEVEICSTFGCGKRLSLQERLSGTKCSKHKGKIPFNFFDGRL